MGGEITLQDALEQIESSNVTERTKGLDNLKYVLRRNTRYDSLSNNAFHRIYETLFSVTITEQSSYLKAKTTTTRTAAEKRLSLSGSSLRHAVEVGVHSIKSKTVKAVFDHVTATLTLPNGNFCDPLALDYARCLRSLISYRPHAEHLSKDDREQIATFCFECIRHAESELADDNTMAGAESHSMKVSLNGLSYKSSRSNFKESGDSQGSRSLAKQIAEEMVACLSLLTATPNAVPGSKAEDLLSALVDVLQNGIIGGSSHQDAFAAINHILSWTRTEDIALTRRKTSSFLRLIRNYWSVKSSNDKALTVLRDELLTCWLYVRPYVLASVREQNDLTIRSEVIGLLETIKNEYGNRGERQQLHVDDLRLDIGHPECDSGRIETAVIALCSGKAKAESTWATANILATLCGALSDKAEGDASSENDDEDDEARPRKRQKLTNYFDETLFSSSTGASHLRIGALQTLVFLAQQQLFGTKRLTQAIDMLFASCTDDNSTVSSWAMLALASFASQPNSSSPSLSARWITVWQLGLRAMSNTSTCRAACHLLRILIHTRLVAQQHISELVQNMTTAIDINGPTMLADSVLHLLVTIVKISQQVNPTSSASIAESVLSWTFRNFWPSKFANREYAGQQSLLESCDIIEVVSCCLNQHIHHAQSYEPHIWYAVGQVWIACSQQHEVVDYLLLLAKADGQVELINRLHSERPNAYTLHQSRFNCEALVLNHLISEMYRAQEEWNQLTEDRPRAVTLDAFAALCKCSLVVTSVAFCTTFRDARRQTQLQKQVREMLQKLADFAGRSNCDQEKFDTMLMILAPACNRRILDDTDRVPCKCEHQICHTIVKATATRRDLVALNGRHEAEDEMDLDDAFESQGSVPGGATAATDDIKSEQCARSSLTALRANIAFYAMAITIRCQSLATDANNTAEASKQVVDYMLSLPEVSILLNSHLVESLSHIGIDINNDDCSRLLEYCAENVLRSHSYERNEVALGAVLDMMSSLAPILTNSPDTSLHTLGIDIYKWYSKVALRGGVLSPSVQTRLASLLLQLCHVDTDYGRDDEVGVQSVRTSLFGLVKLGTITVQFYLAHRISTIFGLYILSNHAAMFDDLQAALPISSDWTEGIAMRLLFLAKLAAAWNSLLRQCVYYIFETAGKVKNSTEYAARSMKDLAASLDFDTPKRLFRIFAPQLLHTWLETHKVTELPFAVFQYPSLHALIEQNQSEIAAQLLLGGDDSAINVVVEALGTDGKQLFARSFAQCLAYCMAWDISRSTATSNEAFCENRLRTIVGTRDDYRTLLASQFPAIMGHFYLSLQQDDAHDAWLEKRQEFSVAVKALGEIKEFGHSDREVPSSQQPHFKNKYLWYELERLCKRTGHRPVNLWEPSSLPVALRMLIDSIEDALGPLHTCLVIRKIRLLVSMAGKHALSGYSTQMLLHALHPFLADSQCADDVIGILQYLLHHGQKDLQTDMSFLYGTTTIMILLMQKHAVAEIDSTTQESQHQSTIQRMQSFQNWLVEYLRKCLPSEKSRDLPTYSRMVEALKNISLPGNALKGSPESALLLLLLEDSSSIKPALKEADRREALVLLSHGFQTPGNLNEECLNSDSECVQYADSLWRIIRYEGLSEALLSWAVAAVGRAYASSGRRPRSDQDKDLSLASGPSIKYEGVATSEASIAIRLSALLFSRIRSEASLADITLRNVLTSFETAEEQIAFEQMLPIAIVPSMKHGTQGYNPFRHDSKGAPRLANDRSLEDLLGVDGNTTLQLWCQRVVVALCDRATDIGLLCSLSIALRNNEKLALELFPAIAHILLMKELDKDQTLREQLSKSVASHFASDSDLLKDKQRYLIQLLLYLRKQPLPHEDTQADRSRWLEVDWLAASQASVRCGMPAAALMFAELTPSTLTLQNSRRSSSRMSMSQMSTEQVPQELLVSIFKSLEEPDSFYAVEQPASIDSILDRLDFESDGYRSLMFRSAQNDTCLRRTHRLGQADSAAMVRSLSMLNLNSLVFALLSGGYGSDNSSSELTNTARRLQQWDIVPTDDAHTGASSTFAAFQELSRSNDRGTSQARLRVSLLQHVARFTQSETLIVPPREWFSALGSLAEIGQVISCTNAEALRSTWTRMQGRQSWMTMGKYEDFQMLVANRHTLFSVLTENKDLGTKMGISMRDCRIIEAETLLSSSRLAREHGRLQEALAAAYECSELTKGSNEVTLKAEVAAKVEIGLVLWDLGEVAPSVRMLQDAHSSSASDKQDIPVGRSGLLAQTAHQLAKARLERPDEILSKYLKPAITHLSNRDKGKEAGKVFFEFASFCDSQLQNPENTEDFRRITKLRERKSKEVKDLEGLARSSKGTNKELGKEFKDAKLWLKIDEQEYQRQKKSRDTYIESSLENYLRALRASDEHNISVLRFFALWLENSEEPIANNAVNSHLQTVPAWKFVVLMNQLMSRLEHDSTKFQASLKSLATRICAEHPYHSLHHLFALSRKPANDDQAALSRYNVAKDIHKTLRADGKKRELVETVFRANEVYDELASEELEGARQGHKIAIKDVPTAMKVAKVVPGLSVPPTTMDVPLQPSGNYKDIPIVTQFSQRITIMSGKSVPKKIVAIASNGKAYVQLFKMGDDLRQDAIMEQVFGEVSKMLQNHKATRQRNLHVRTYKVIPLSTSSGIIEFVPHSISFSDFLKSAHHRYHPKDLKDSEARHKVIAVSEQPKEVKIKEYQAICDRVHPVMRHFFLERFKDPDEWFEKRTAYTRTTATISILGYVLGLGDRHCQNIMMDEKTGEVVHIDLGVAFEAGRILPIPEMIPFRLSRDVIDGMGITKTEGVFRRCCEFTLEALQADKDSIMTLLNVLRYDPLYSWTLSPLRAKRMQEQSVRNADTETGEGSSKKKEQEAGEADRALSLVEKKLSTTLSTAATVNELIQQATDIKNLATLFHGWSAYF